MSRIAPILLIAVVGDSLSATIKAGCSIAINGGLPNPQPLVLKVRGSHDGFGFPLPTPTGIINIAAHAAIRLVCAGPKNYFTKLGTTTNDIQATCIDGTTFSVSGKNRKFSSLRCKQNPVHTAVRSGASCYNGHDLVDIGFQAGNKFIKIMQICFDDAKLNAVWSKYDLVSSIGGKQVGFPRPSFVAGTFYPGLNPDTQYNSITQTATFAKLLGSKALANKWISPKTDYFLTRGHLTANADFVYGSQHRATFYYINVAPQWQTFNGGNWNTLEDNTRTFASARALDLEVYTGTSGVITFPNTAGTATPIYLYQDSNNNNQIPVPAVYWKIVYDPKTQKGVALIGVNNPYLTKAQLGAEYLLCDDVCAQISWVKWAKDNQQKGFGYCCDVNKFRSKVPSVPKFPVTGLLV